MRKLLIGVGLFLGPVLFFLLLLWTLWVLLFAWVDALLATAIQVAVAVAIFLLYWRLRRRVEPGVPVGAFLAGAIVCGVLTAPVVLLSPMMAVISTHARRSNLILNKTDPEKLMAACREIMKNHDRYRRIGSGQTKIDTEDPTLPELVRNLEPEEIIADNTSVWIPIVSSVHDQCGVVAFADEAKVPIENRVYRLCPGLWFYEGEGPLRGVHYPPGSLRQGSEVNDAPPSGE